jgi:alanine-synthesizing transaminase
MFAQRTNWSLVPNRFSQALERARASGRKLLDLTASNPTTVGLDYDREALLRALAQPDSLQYQPQARGLVAAREAVAAYYRERGESVDPTHILLTASTSEAYSFIFRLLCDPGDEVLIPAPSYPLFQFLADIQDVRLRHYPLFYDHGWQIDLHALEAKLTPRTRAIVLVHPNNPTGSYVSAAEKERLGSLCAARQLALVVDEVFLDFAHDGQLRSSFVTNRDLLTFSLSGLSKVSGLPQMKLAWIVVSGPDESAGAALERLEVIADTYLSVSTPVQLAASAFLGQRRRFRSQLMERIGANLAELDGRLQGSAVRRLEVQGGWYAVLRLPVTGSDEELAIALLEDESVVVHPGHFYDFAAEGHLVVSLIAPREEFRQGIGRIVESAARSG